MKMSMEMSMEGSMATPLANSRRLDSTSSQTQRLQGEAA
jgi:hypothetical protein